MEPPSIEELETRENFVANMGFYQDMDIAERILELSVANGFLNDEFALQLIEANPDCYKANGGEEWEQIIEQENVALFAVQQDETNLGYVQDELKSEEFLARALSNHGRTLNEVLPQWKNRPDLIRIINPLTEELLDQIDPEVFKDVEVVNAAFPTWKTDLKLIKYFLPFNETLFNEIDPYMYDNQQLFEFIRKEKIPLALLNKGIPQQERFKKRMNDLRTLALTQKRSWNIGSNVKGERGNRFLPMGLPTAYRVQYYLGGPKFTRGGKRRKTKRRK